MTGYEQSPHYGQANWERKPATSVERERKRQMWARALDTPAPSIVSMFKPVKLPQDLVDLIDEEASLQREQTRLWKRHKSIISACWVCCVLALGLVGLGGGVFNTYPLRGLTIITLGILPLVYGLSWFGKLTSVKQDYQSVCQAREQHQWTIMVFISRLLSENDADTLKKARLFALFTCAAQLVSGRTLDPETAARLVTLVGQADQHLEADKLSNPILTDYALSVSGGRGRFTSHTADNVVEFPRRPTRH